MKKTIIVAAASVIITLAGTALAYTLLADNSRDSQYQDFSYNQYAAQGVAASSQQGTAQQYGGCRGGRSGGCGGCGNRGAAGTQPGATGASQSDALKAIEELAAKYYIDTYGDTDFTVKVQDYGCHQEAFILKDGQPIKKLSISGGNVYEVG